MIKSKNINVFFFQIIIDKTNHEYIFQWNQQYNKKYNQNSNFFNDTNNNLYSL